MNYCSECGEKVSKQIPEGDDRPRYVCDACQTIHYQNPRIIVGTIPLYGDKVLLCRRAIEPRRGFWTVPAGFMENSETTLQGAQRETWEEARARVDNARLYRLFDLPHISQVYMFYLADLLDGEFGTGPESLEVELFEEGAIPWEEIAFPVVSRALREYFADRQTGVFPVRISDIDPIGRQSRSPQAPG